MLCVCVFDSCCTSSAEKQRERERVRDLCRDTHPAWTHLRRTGPRGVPERRQRKTCAVLFECCFCLWIHSTQRFSHPSAFPRWRSSRCNAGGRECGHVYLSIKINDTVFSHSYGCFCIKTWIKRITRSKGIKSVMLRACMCVLVGDVFWRAVCSALPVHSFCGSPFFFLFFLLPFLPSHYLLREKLPAAAWAWNILLPPSPPDYYIHSGDWQSQGLEVNWKNIGCSHNKCPRVMTGLARV